MKIFLRLLFSVIFFLGLLSASLPQTYAAVTCNCQNPNTPGSGNNGMDCSDGTTKYCSEWQVCVGTNNNAACQNLNCSCDQSNISGGGNNGYSCTINGQTSAYHAYCPSNDYACRTPTPNVIDCFIPTGPAPQPSPPPAPCVHLSSQAHCDSVSTAFGIFSTDPGQFISSAFGILLGLAGSIAVLLIIYSGYQMMVSRGNPEKLQNAKEQLTAAIIGLLFMIFSFVILQIIGVDILKIPGLTP